MRIVLAALIVLALAAPAAAHVDRGAAPIYVVIFKGKPLPAEKHVPLHGSATWLNGDKRSHRIASDNHVWPPFALARGARHAVRFDRLGRYPYKVDGKAKGVIVVSAGGGAGGGGTGGGLSTTLIHYDVHVTGHAESVNTYTGETLASRNGTETLDFDWDTKFTNATLKKLGASGTFVIGPQSGTARGTTDATYAFTETRGDFYGPCQGTVPFSALGTHLLLAGSRANGRNSFMFWSQLDLEEGTRIAKEFNDRTKQTCAPTRGGSAKGEPGWAGEDPVAQGLTFSPFVSLLELHAERKDSLASLWSPLSNLFAGTGFMLDTGDVNRTGSCGSNCQAQYQLRLHADVTRHR